MCIVGRVGQGKSSLVQAMLGEMEKDQGHVKVGYGFCLCWKLYGFSVCVEIGVQIRINALYFVK